MLYKNLLLGSELSTSTVMVPVTGTDVSTTNVQFWDGRAMAVGKPLSADTCTFANAIVGKMSTSQKSNVHTDAAVCVIDLVACVVFAFPLKELWAMRTPVTEVAPAAIGPLAWPKPSHPRRLPLQLENEPTQHSPSVLLPVMPSHCLPGGHHW